MQYLVRVLTIYEMIPSNFLTKFTPRNNANSALCVSFYVVFNYEVALMHNMTFRNNEV